MYKQGMAYVDTGVCKEDGCPQAWEDAPTCGHGTVYDSARGDAPSPSPSVALPHSCDSWVIGGREQVQQLIADLQALLPSL